MFNQTNNDEARRRRASEVPVVVWRSSRPWLSRPRVHQGAAWYAKFKEIKSAELRKIMETTYIFIFGWMIGNTVITELSNFDNRSNFWLFRGGSVLVTILLKRLYPNLRERQTIHYSPRGIILISSAKLISWKTLTHLMLSTLVHPSLLRSSISAVSYENRVHVWMQMIARVALPNRKMRCASRTWRVKTVWSYGVTYSLSSP